MVEDFKVEINLNSFSPKLKLIKKDCSADFNLRFKLNNILVNIVISNPQLDLPDLTSLENTIHNKILKAVRLINKKKSKKVNTKRKARILTQNIKILLETEYKEYLKIVKKYTGKKATLMNLLNTKKNIEAIQAVEDYPLLVYLLIDNPPGKIESFFPLDIKKRLTFQQAAQTRQFLQNASWKELENISIRKARFLVDNNLLDSIFMDIPIVYISYILKSIKNFNRSIGIDSEKSFGIFNELLSQLHKLDPKEHRNKGPILYNLINTLKEIDKEIEAADKSRSLRANALLLKTASLLKQLELDNKISSRMINNIFR